MVKTSREYSRRTPRYLQTRFRTRRETFKSNWSYYGFSFNLVLRDATSGIHRCRWKRGSFHTSLPRRLKSGARRKQCEAPAESIRSAVLINRGNFLRSEPRSVASWTGRLGRPRKFSRKSPTRRCDDKMNRGGSGRIWANQKPIIRFFLSFFSVFCKRLFGAQRKIASQSTKVHRLSNYHEQIPARGRSEQADERVEEPYKLLRYL